jgi:secreted trypsin-like serine protease
MLRLLPLLAMAILATLVAASPTSALSGGATVDIATVPFVVGTGSCTGTLIAPDRILTAAHCVEHAEAPFFTFIGVDANDFPHPDSATYSVKEYSIAPGFKLQFPFAHKRPQNATAVNDVALAVLDRPVPGIAPVAVAGPGDAALEQPGKPVRLLGYGETSLVDRTHPPTLDPLQGGDLSLITKAACLKAYPKAVVSKEICAQDVSHDGALTQPCAGDSGGPLLAEGPSGPVQIGVTSWGAEVKDNGCGVARLPAVWMRVSSFHDFLTDPSPTFAPHAGGKVGLRGSHRLTCVAPSFGGSPAKLSYQWGIPRFKGRLIQQIPHPMRPIKGATSKHFTRGGSRTRGEKVACAVTAKNAGGDWTVYSRTVAG